MENNHGFTENEFYQGYLEQDVMAQTYHTSLSGYHDPTSFSTYLPSENVCSYFEPYCATTNSTMNSVMLPPPQQLDAPLHAPVFGSRVHINPNFHPKPSGHPEKDPASQKSGNVYINPHWKRKSEGKHTTKPSETSGSASGRKTIFINPKMLAAIQSSSTLSPNKFFQTAPSSIPCTESRAANYSEGTDDSLQESCASTPAIMKKMQQDVCFSEVYQPSNQSISDVAGHLVHHQLDDKKSPANSGNIYFQNTVTCHVSDLKSPASPISISSKLRTAKQIRSKYKLVRNVPVQSSFLTPLKSSFLNGFGKAKKKTMIGRSSFKYVNKQEWKKHSSKLSSKYKLVNKNGVPSSQCNSVQNPLCCRSVPLRAKKINNGNKILKTRYKFIKQCSLPPSLKATDTPANTGQIRKLNSRFKLVRESSATTPSKLKTVSRKQTLPSSSLSTSLMLKSQFKFVRNSQNRSLPLKKVSRYSVTLSSGCKSKIRSQQTFAKWSSLCSRSLQATGLKTPWPHHYQNRIWRNKRSLQSFHMLRNKHKLNHFAPASRINSSSMLITKSPGNLLRIGGVLYKSTPTSLTRAQPCGSAEQVLNIRGCKFVLDSKGATLRPMMVARDGTKKKDSRAPLSRVDIGGVTFVRRNDNTLHRTNTHHARTLLSSAKMKSIALLTAKLRKNNQPCLIYNRFGKCFANEKGKCWRVHDKKNVSICQKFLQGHCEITGCLLSHNIGPEKMPTCKYFLNGCCVRDQCPYLHVKLSSRAAICKQFLDGYCSEGDMCKKRHVHICPKFESEGKCSKGKYCPYPHPTAGKNRIKKKKVNSASTSKIDPESGSICPNPKLNHSIEDKIYKSNTPNACLEMGNRNRYYQESKPSTSKSPVAGEEYTTSLREKRHRILKQIDHLRKMRSGALDDPDLSSSSDSDMNEEEPSGFIKDRPKIGILPAYIPLE